MSFPDVGNAEAEYARRVPVLRCETPGSAGCILFQLSRISYGHDSGRVATEWAWRNSATSRPAIVTPVLAVDTGNLVAGFSGLGSILGAVVCGNSP